MSDSTLILPPVAQNAGLYGAVKSVNTPVDLAALNDVDFPQNTRIVVNCFIDSFELDRTSTLLADGITVVATLSATGRWIRRNTSSLQWQNQTTWWISSTGNDVNSGVDSVHALKTFAEYRRRVGTSRRVKINTSISVAGLTFLEVLELDEQIDLGVTLSVAGTLNPALLLNTTISNVTPFNKLTGQQLLIGASSMAGTWTSNSLLGCLVTVIGGPRAAYQSWVLEDQGTPANYARVSQLVSPITQISVLAVVNDQVSISKLPTFNQIQVSTTGFGQVVLANLAAAACLVSSLPSCKLVNCKFTQLTSNSKVNVSNCLVNNVQVLSSTCTFFDGAVTGLSQVFSSGTWVLDNDVVVQNQILVTGMLQVYNADVLVPLTAAIKIQEFGKLSVQNSPTFGTCTLWGQVAFTVDFATSFCEGTYELVPTAVNTNGYDFKFLGATHTWASLPLYDSLNHIGFLQRF